MNNDLISYPAAVTFLVFAGILAVTWIAINLLDCIQSIKEAKYQALSSSVGYDYDLYDFARWLDSKDLNEGFSFEGLVDDYITEIGE